MFQLNWLEEESSEDNTEDDEYAFKRKWKVVLKVSGRLHASVQHIVSL